MWSRLTRKEKDIGLLLIEGLEDQEIAAIIGRSKQTIKMHMRSIRQKLKARNRVEAAVLLAVNSMEEKRTGVLRGVSSAICSPD